LAVLELDITWKLKIGNWKFSSYDRNKKNYMAKIRNVKKVLVIYHGDCPDGFSGAWAAWKKFGNTAEYFAASREAGPPDVKGRKVYCIDFTYRPAAVVKKMAREAEELVLIDHHITSKPLMELAPEFWFSLEHSAAVLAWEYFFPSKPVPQLLKYVEDGDLWKFKLPKSRELGAYMSVFDFSFKNWDALARTFQSAARRTQAAKEGAFLLRFTQGVVRYVVDNARLVRFEGMKVLAANAAPMFHSEIGHALAKKKPPLGIVWREERGVIRVSLRSNGKVDVAKVAEKYGGGGHKAAAGFNVPVGGKLPWE
jgi:hypothetical protein